MWRNTKLGLVLAVGLTAASQWGSAQGTYVLTNTVDSSAVSFSNTLGIASTTNGTMIVFEGQLDSTLVVNKDYNALADSYLASLQLLIQIKLFDELPLSNDLDNVQGAVAALRDSAGSSNGTYYAWGVTNGSLLGWQQLRTTNNLPFQVADGGTNYVTFVFSYPAAGAVTYQVFIGEPLPGGGKGDMAPSLPVATLTPTSTAGISSLSLLGEGVVQQVGSSSGSVTPLSTSIDLSVYVSSNSVYADVSTVNESGTKPIRIYAKINGVWTLVGTIPSDALYGESHIYRRIALNGLTAGQTYEFQIVDEADHLHVFSNVSVETLTIGDAAFVKGDLQTLEVVFNTTEGRTYQVKVCENIAAPADQWKPEFVSQYKGNGVWGDISTNAFQAGPGTQTQIRIPVSYSKAFFRIFRLDGE